MRTRRCFRGALVACNLLLLSAAMPTVGHSQEYTGQKAKAGSSFGTKPTRTISKPSKTHRASGRVRPTRTGSASSSDSSSSSSSDDDDDDSGAGRVFAACCVGVVGAMADGAAHDATDAEYVEHESEASTRWEGAGESSPPRASFDALAAKDALAAAHEQVEQECVTQERQLDRHKLTVTFHPGGTAGAVKLEPPPASEELHQCAYRVFKQARVPRFAGAATTVTKTIRGRTWDASEPLESGSGGR